MLKRKFEVATERNAINRFSWLVIAMSPCSSRLLDKSCQQPSCIVRMCVVVEHCSTIFSSTNCQTRVSASITLSNIDS